LVPGSRKLISIFYSLADLEAFKGSDVAVQNECGINAKVLLILASNIIVGFESLGTHSLKALGTFRPSYCNAQSESDSRQSVGS
jgi:hypothetical protein